MHRMHCGSSFLRNSFGNVVDSRTPCCKGSYGDTPSADRCRSKRAFTVYKL